MLQTIRSLWRLLVIARTLARHDALAALEGLQLAPGILWVARLGPWRRGEGRAGEKLARALTELGPGFIKLGQFLSTRADLLGEELAADLSDLQDRLPPFPSAEARAIIQTELGEPVETLFARFDDEPISAASIAQVHLAAVAAGEDEAPPREVAVKVLRPGVEGAFERDLKLLYWLAALAERTQPGLRRFRLREVVQLFEDTVRIEMDLRMEAAAAAELAENFGEDETYVVPAVDWQRTSRRVLTVGCVGGIPIDDREALVAAGHDLEEVLTKAAVIFFNQVFRDGFFHGDQHPGNMFVDEQSNIVAVDFGIMGRLDRKTQSYLAEMLLALLAKDYRHLAEVYIEAGYLPPDQPRDVFAQALRSVSEPIFDRPLEEISFARLLARLLQLSESFHMPVQPQLLLLQKNMMMAEGVSRRLLPGLNIWTLAAPLIGDWVRENRGVEARVRDAADQLTEVLGELPAMMRDLRRAAAALAVAPQPLMPADVQQASEQQTRRDARLAIAIALVALLLGAIALL